MDVDSSYIGRICQQYAETQASTILDMKNVDVYHAFFSEWCAWCTTWKKKNLHAAVVASHEAKQGKGIRRKRGEARLKTNPKIPVRMVGKVGKDGKVSK
jgi:hypothetical protein